MERKENRIIVWIKKEAVLSIALALACISAFLVKPSVEYLSYLDFRVLVLLFCLMLVVGGFKSLGIFGFLGEKLCSHVKSLRGLNLVLVSLCFFGSMLITNDVSLITFVPFTLSVYRMIACEECLIPVVVLETVAANLGSMMTPIGNPQNLLLFSISGMGAGEFVWYMLPLTCVSFLLILFCVMKIPNKRIVIQSHDNKETMSGAGCFTWQFWVYCVLFVVCLGNVFHLYSHWVVGVIVAIAVLFVNRRLFATVDYSLLMTFVGFFIFIGNMKQIDMINNWLQGIIAGNELPIGIIASQIISNVPAAMLLSGFTANYKALLYGVNIGGLGTLIASMASLISYRFYVKAYPLQKGKYFRTFTLYNFIMLIILYGIALV